MTNIISFLHEVTLAILNHLEILPFEEIAEISRLGNRKAPRVFLIILKLKLSIPDLLLIFSEKTASFNSLINKDLDSIITFTFLVNVLDDFGI